MRSVFIIVFVFSISYGGVAQNKQLKSDSLQATAKKLNLMLGAGAVIASRYEGGNNYFMIPTIAFSADWLTGQYIRLSAAGLEGNFSKRRKWEYGPKASFVLPRNGSFNKTGSVNNLEALDFSVFLGAFGRYRFVKKFDVKAEFIYDITGVSNGGLATLEFGYTRKVNRWILNYVISTSYATKNYMSTYFGVHSNNIGSSYLPFYNTTAGFKDIGFKLTESYMLSQRWMFVYSLGYKYLFDEAANSPIVNEGSRNQCVGSVILMYRL